jgi:quinol monooxygenase YgiN
MFARNVVLRLRPSSLNQFKQTVDAQVIPLLRNQPGFKDLITFALLRGTEVTAISLWQSREHAEAYHTSGYARVMKTLEPLLDGNPKLRIADIVSSTFHKVTDRVAALGRFPFAVRAKAIRQEA